MNPIFHRTMTALALCATFFVGCENKNFGAGQGFDQNSSNNNLSGNGAGSGGSTPGGTIGSGNPPTACQVAYTFSGTSRQRARLDTDFILETAADRNTLILSDTDCPFPVRQFYSTVAARFGRVLIPVANTNDPTQPTFQDFFGAELFSTPFEGQVSASSASYLTFTLEKLPEFRQNGCMVFFHFADGLIGETPVNPTQDTVTTPRRETDPASGYNIGGTLYIDFRHDSDVKPCGEGFDG